jgi:hypothetical protein
MCKGGPVCNVVYDKGGIGDAENARAARGGRADERKGRGRVRKEGRK